MTMRSTRGPRARPAPRSLHLHLLPALALLAAACARGSAAGPAPERPPANVAVASAVERDVPVYLDEIGKATAREVVTVRPQVSGPVVGIHFEDGADVKRGDLLFTIDPRPYRAQLDAAAAALAQNEAALALARTELQRAERLVGTEAVTRQEYDARKSAVAVSEAQVRASRAAVATARLNLEYCTVRSPIDGRAGQRQADLGNIVTPGGGGTALVVVQRLDPVYADFTIPEKELDGVQRAMAEARLKVQVRLPDEPEDGGRAGDLTFVDNAVQGGTGTVRLRATLGNGDHRFWPGRFVKVRLVLGTERNAVLVPASAPQVSAKGTFVYVVKRDATAEMRPVRLGQRQGELVAVAEGVAAGEQVVTTGQLAVTPGGKVHASEAGAKTAQARSGR
jgi:multidrug efflux system membrane fusion protein